MKFMRRLLEIHCSHRLSWPRTDAKGQHYQICLTCGTAFEYDWRKMRRTGRLLVTTPQHGPRWASTQ